MIELAPLSRPDAWLPTPPRRRTPWWRHAVTVVVLGALAILLIAATTGIVARIVGRGPRQAHASPLGLIGEFLVLMLLFPPVVLAHEAGHAIAGSLAGWRLQSLFVGPWRFIRDDAGMRVTFHRSYFYYGGAAVLVPPEWRSDEYIRRSFRHMVAGGPLASVLLALGLLAIAFAGRVPQHGATHGWRFFVFVAGTMSLAIGLGTLLPIRQTSTIRNDGLQLVLSRPRDRLGHPRPLDRGIRIGALVLLLTERRPRDWSNEVMAMFDALPAYQRRMLEYYHALDVMDLQRARTLLQSSLDHIAAMPGDMGARTRTEAALEATIFEVAWRGDVSAARRWLSLSAGGERTDPHLAALARAAVHAAAGEYADAREAVAQARRDARRRTVARVDLILAPLIERVRSLIK